MAIAAGGKKINISKGRIVNVSDKNKSSSSSSSGKVTIKASVDTAGNTVVDQTIGDVRTVDVSNKYTGSSSSRSTNVKTGQVLSQKEVIGANISPQSTQQKILQAQKKGLQTRIVDAKSGKVIQAGRFNASRKDLDSLNELQRVKRIEQKRMNEELARNKIYSSELQTRIPNRDLIKFNKDTKKTLELPKKTEQKDKFTLFGRTLKTAEQVEQEGIIAGQSGTWKGKAKEFIYRGQADFVGGVKATYNLAKDINNAIYKRGDEQIIAQNKVKNVLNLATLQAMGGAIGSDLQSSNPYEKTRGMLAILPVVGVPLKLKSGKVATAITDFNTKANPFKGSIKTTTSTKGILETGKEFSQKSTFRYEPKSKTLYGNSKVTIDGKTTTENFVFKDKGGFYEDKKGRKIPKSYLPVKNARVNIKEVSIGSKNIDKVRTYEGQVIIIGQRLGAIKKTTQYIDFTKKKKTTITRQKQFELDFAKDWKEKGTKIKEVKSLKGIFINPTSKLSKINLKNTYTSKQLENFLKSVNYDKTIVNGLDKRNRLAIALGLPEKSKKLTKIKKLLDVYFKNENKGLKTQFNGMIRSKGQIIEVNQIKYRLSSLTSPIFEDLLKINKKTKKGRVEVPNNYAIPKLELKIKKIKKLRMPLNLKTNLISKLEMQLQSKKTEQKRKEKLKSPQKIKIPSKQKVPARKQKNIQKQKKVVVSKNKQVPKLKETRLRIGRNIRIPKMIEEKLIKLPNLPTFKSKLPKGYTYAYDGKIKVKGKIKTIKLGLPTNRALSKVGRLIDNTTSRSMQLVPIGIIKKTQDITKPTILGKFKVRKGKKALILVEKTKHTIDTLGEKRGLSIGKLLSPKKKIKSPTKTKSKAKKTITKAKKSSQKRFKAKKTIKIKKKAKRR